MKTFWALVANSQKLRKNNVIKSTIWWKLYVTVFILAGLIGYSVLIYRGMVAPFTLLFVAPYLILINFSLSAASIRQEWRGQTIAWWLTLPYSRLELLLAKLVANFIRFLKIAGISIVVLVLLSIEGMWLNPALWSSSTVGGIAAVAVKLYFIAIATSPAAITLGMFLAVTMHSRLKPLVPIIWALAAFIFSWALHYVSNFFSRLIKGAAISAIPQIPVSMFSMIAFGVVVPLVLSAAFLGASTYILAEKTEV